MIVNFDSFSIKKQLVISLIVVVAYTTSAELAQLLKFTIIHSIPVFYPAGLAFAAALLFGKRILPAIFFGAFCSALLALNYRIDTPEILLTNAFISASGIFLQALAGLSLLKYFNGETAFLRHVRSTFNFVVVALIMSLVGSSIGIIGRWGTGLIEADPYLTTMFKWWLGNVIGILIFTPLIVSFSKNIFSGFSLTGLFEVLSLFTITFIFAQIIFGDWIQTELINSLPFLIIPILLWIAFRFSPKETTLATLLVSIIAIWGTINGNGPFIREDANLSQLVLQMYLGITAIMSVILSVSVQERKRAVMEFNEISESLERRVIKRTDELATLNKELLVEVNQRKKAEAELKESQERNHALLSSLPDIIFLYDNDGVFIDYQASNQDSLYIEPEKFLGKNFKEVLPDEISTDLSKIFKEIRKTGQTKTYEYALFINNKKIFFEARISICGDNRVMSVVRDISDKKMAEEQRQQLEEQVRHTQKLESLGILAGGIAHDFNNLLTAIMGNTGLAMMSIGESRAKKNLQKIERASLRAADLCRQLLAYSGKGKFIVELININKLVSEMSKLLDVSKSKKVSFIFDFDEKVPGFDADATQIRQVVMNLITNASEAIGDKSGNVTIKTGSLHCSREYLREAYFDDELDEGDYIFLDVSDDGSGMTEETLSKIFDPFYTTKFTGRGLGLAAVIGIVRSHKGAIMINSNENQGTTFRILFPASKNQFINEVVDDSSPIFWKGTGTVLVVDDDESIRDLGKNTLERAGLKVITADDGKDAVGIYKKHHKEINLVLMDMTMPNLSGDEAYKELQAIRSDVKVILSSGYSEQEATQKFMEDGLSGFLQKPYKPTDLLIKVKDIMSQTI